MKQILGRLGLALLSGLCLAAYARAPALAFVNYVALVPWIVLYTDPRRPRISAVYYIVSVFVAWVLFYRVAFQFGWWAPVITAFVFCLPWLPFATVLRRVHHRFRLPRTLSVPLIWVGFEWLRATFTLAHFDLFLLGYAMAKFPVLIQVSDITGVYGISFVLAGLNGFFADLYFLRRDGAGARRRLAFSGAALALVVAACIGYGLTRVNGAQNVEGPRLAVVQPNEAHTLWNQVGVHLSQVLLTERLVAAGEADLIVWPENSILDHLDREGVYLDDLKWLATEKQARLLIGAMGKRDDRPGKTTNSAFLVEADAGVVARYDKQILFPWTEYIPADDFLGRVAPLVQRIHRGLARRAWGSLSPGVPGDRMSLFRIPWDGGELPFAALICVENSYPPVPAAAGRMGARMLVNITSEGRVAGLIQEQLLRVCMLRAVENRSAYVRVGNTGVSGIIDPQGRIQSILRGERGATVGDSGVLIDRVPLSDRRTPTLYARSRDAFAKACSLATLVLLTWTFVRPRRAAAALLVPLVLLGATGCSGGLVPGDDPAGAREAFRQGRTMFEQGRRGGTVGFFAAACADADTCRQAMPFLAQALRSIQEFEQGITFFGAVAERYPQLSAEALGYRGGFLERTGLLADAERDYLRSIEIEPSARVWAMLGALRLRLENREGAEEAFLEGLKLAPRDTQILYALGRSLWRQRDLEGAEKRMREVLAYDPEHAPAWTGVGRVLMVRGDSEGAEEAFRRAVLVDPESVEARFMMTRLTLRAGRKDEARRWLREIREIEKSRGRTSRVAP